MTKPQRPAKLAELAVSRQQSFHGPIPPPALLEHYDKIIPGAAERILAMAESETVHRHQQETLAIEANIAVQQHQIRTESRQTQLVFRSDIVGQILGFSLSLASIAGCIWLALADQNAAAIALITLPLAGIIRALRTQKH
jgi:uncharacterized membrane protein